jgi:D-lactate dehydrogenase
VYKNPAMVALGAEYVSLEELYKNADIISLHCPLMPNTHHIINTEAVAQMKKGVLLINTSRGGLIDTDALIQGLQKGTIGGAGLDVYENEETIFFKDHAHEHVLDELITGASPYVDGKYARLQSFPNVLITGHQAWFTKPAVTTIADVTRQNIDFFSGPEPDKNPNMCTA